MNTDTQIVILAAGKGTRMGGDIPKALTLLGNKPMVKYVVDAAINFSSNKPIAVIGYKGNLVKDNLGNCCTYVYQKEQNGTGHAVMTAKELLLESKADTVIILVADQPYLSSQTLEKLAKKKHDTNAKIVIATTIIDDDNLFENQFYNFGRIIRDKNDTITKIIEKRDADEKELLIREVNPANFCLDKKWMLEKLENLDNNNSQGEYYLTDLVQMAFDENLNIESVEINEKEALAANTPEQLAILESFLEK